MSPRHLAPPAGGAPTTSPRTAPRIAAALAVALVLAACSEPELPEGPVEDTGTSPAPAAEDLDDTDADQLEEAIAQLASAVEAAAAHLDAAAGASGRSQVQAEAERALGVLLEDAGTRSSEGPLLPAESPERETIGDRDDLFGSTLALARDVGGETGETVVELLRDELVGDLGSWERDAAGVLTSVERAATSPGSLEQRTDRILELPGEATRALAWTLAAIDADDTDAATTAADRASAHLELVGLALDELTAQLPAPGSDT